MGSKKAKTYVQCTRCGNVHNIRKFISVEEMYTNTYCEKCKCILKHINLGNDKNEIDLFKDINIDSRWYL